MIFFLNDLSQRCIKPPFAGILICKSFTPGIVTAYIKRVIAHPSFHNIDYKECQKILDKMDQGDCIIRPSSKVSSNHAPGVKGVLARMITWFTYSLQ